MRFAAGSDTSAGPVRIVCAKAEHEKCRRPAQFNTWTGWTPTSLIIAAQTSRSERPSLSHTWPNHPAARLTSPVNVRDDGLALHDRVGKGQFHRLEGVGHLP